MPQIVYAGHTPEVSVPAHRLTEVRAGEPIDVPQHVRDDLTAHGTSSVWLDVVDGAPVVPDIPPPLVEDEPAADPAGGRGAVDVDTLED